MQAAQFLFHLLQGDEEAKTVLSSCPQRERYCVYSDSLQAIVLMSIAGCRWEETSAHLLISLYGFWRSTSYERSRSQISTCISSCHRICAMAAVRVYLPASLPMSDGFTILFCTCVTLIIVSPFQVKGTLFVSSAPWRSTNPW